MLIVNHRSKQDYNGQNVRKTEGYLRFFCVLFQNNLPSDILVVKNKSSKDEG
jgi:hypothetical protein